jgi:hypothetical protein
MIPLERTLDDLIASIEVEGDPAIEATGTP